MQRKKVKIANKKKTSKKPAQIRKAPAKKKPTRKTVIKLEAPAFSVAPIAIKPVIHLKQNLTTTPAMPKPVFHAPKSPHVLNLKKIAFENHIHETRRDQKSNEIRKEISRELTAAAGKLDISTKKTGSFFGSKKKETPQIQSEGKYYPLPKNTVVSHVILDEEIAPRKPAYRLSRIKLPRMTIPKLSLGQLMPNFNGPLFSGTYTRNTVISFVIASLLLVSPLWAFDTYQKVSQTKGKVLGIATSAFEDIKNSNNGTNTSELSQAAEKLQQAEQELSNVPDLVNAILAVAPQGTKLASGNSLLRIAKESSGLAEALVALLSSAPDSQSLYQRLETLLPALTQQRESIASISKDVAAINPDDIPEQYRDQFKGVAGIISALAPHVDALLEQANLLTAIMGSESAQRYLIVFQNSDELRATGGFMGSFATVTMDKGEMKDFKIPPGGSYDLKAGLKANIEPPQPLTAVSPRWEFQDANYFADFPMSAGKIMSLYEKSGGTTVNGVIAIDSLILPKLLELSGPIHLPTSNMDITSDNVVGALETEIETGANKELNQPKKILRELSDALISKLSSQPSTMLPKLAELLLNALAEREIQMYLKNPDLQAIVAKRNWSGSLIKTNGDYLNIVSTNISGGKTNGVLHDSVSITADIQDDGSVIDTVRLIRRHAGSADQPLANVKNNDFVRFYVPLNSTLLSAHGFEPLTDEAFKAADFPVTADPDLSVIKSSTTVDLASKTQIAMENGKTIFANWIQVSPGETKTVTISYRLPFKVLKQNRGQVETWLDILNDQFSNNSDSIPYSLVLQKQSGKINQTYHIEIHAPSPLTYRWSYPSNLTANGNDFILDQILDRDAIIGIIFTNK